MILAFVIASFFSLGVIASTDNNALGLNPGSPSLNETEPAWWIKALFTGFISALVIILAFALDRVAKWKEEEERKKEFLQSACAQLRNLLACLVLDYGKTKANLDGLTVDDFSWTIRAYREFYLDKVTDPAQQAMPMPKQPLDELSAGELLECAKTVNKSSRKPDVAFIRFTRLDFGFIESGFPMIRQLGVATQELLFRIVGRIRNINECIGELDDEYERSFTCSTNKTLSGRIQENKKTYYKKIASWSYQASNEIMKFLRENWVPCA